MTAAVGLGGTHSGLRSPFGQFLPSLSAVLPDCGTLPWSKAIRAFTARRQRTHSRVVVIKVTTLAPEGTRALTASLGRSQLRRPPFGIWFPLSVFALTRFINFVMISVSARTQVVLTHTLQEYYVYTPTQASPGYLSAITNWDGQWYQRIVEQGYAVTAVSTFDQWAKAFALSQPPIFPMMVMAVMWATGLGFGAAATMVNLLAGSVTVLLLYRLVEPYAGRFAAASAAALLCTFVSAPVLQLAYKDGLALMLIVLAMLLIARRRYWLAVVVILALALTRQVTPPLAIVLAAHAWTRFRNRQDSPVGRGEVTAMAAVFATSIVGLFAWSTIVRFWIGDSDADSGRGSIASIGRTGFGWFGQAYSWAGPFGVAEIVALLLILIWLAHDSRARNWGPETRAWLWAYPAFLMVGTTIHAGQLRYFLADFPLLLVLVGSPPPYILPKIRLTIVAVACLVGLGLQWFWIDNVLIMHGQKITIWMP